jgi:membrane dipeptidase
MPLLIDAHEDLAYSMLTFGRDYRRSAYDTRRIEIGSPHPGNNGDALLGWPEFQKGQVAIVFASLCAMPLETKPAAFENQIYGSMRAFERIIRGQYDLYQKMCEESPDQFQMIRTRRELNDLLALWQKEPANYPDHTNPVGMVLMMEGAEGLSGQAELEEWWQLGVRIIAPVWAGTRYCGGSKIPGKFTAEGLKLLESMADLGYTLDIAHMSEDSVPQALDVYEGSVIASHANARELLKNDPTDRHLPDSILRKLFERDGVIGVMPFNRFLLPGWNDQGPRELVPLSLLIDHIDHICQIAGDSRHVGIGSDFDGGFGWPAVPLEVDTIADLQKIGIQLAERGYSDKDINAIFFGNWLRKLEQGLPA